MFIKLSTVEGVFFCCILTAIGQNADFVQSSASRRFEMADSGGYQNDSYESVQIISDDLIFPETKSADKNETYQRIDLNEEEDENFDNLSEEDGYEDGSHVEPEIESDFVGNEFRVVSIDMSDFLALVPANDIRAVAEKYYRNDPETQRAFTYLRSNEFRNLRENITALPEISSFLKFSNASGLDIIAFVYNLTNLMGKPGDLSRARDDVVTDVDYGKQEQTIVKNSSIPSIATATITTTTTHSTTENLNGLHGLVDSILDLLPQDQILSLFFDKMESSKEFSKLVENISSPEFSRVLQNMEKSFALKNLILTLHNNGIYITRIVESLKAYFFLGTF